MLIDLPGSLDIYNDFIANFFKVRHALHIKDESGLKTRQGRGYKGVLVPAIGLTINKFGRRNCVA